MLTVWQALVLGVIQGFTEFLPVSSDGHLVIAQEGFGLRPPHAIAFDVLLHLGTLVAVLAYFRRDLWDMTRALFGAPGPEMDTNRRWIWLLGLGTAPVALVGFLLKDWFEQTFHSLAWAGGGLLLTGTLLWLVHGKGASGRTAGALTLRDAMMIGGIQSIALLPGVSRSGSTLFCALQVGVERTTAARFSFLLSIPAIAGALTGWLAIEVLMRAVARGSLRGFSVYCWIVGTLTLAWSVWSGVGSQVG